MNSKAVPAEYYKEIFQDVKLENLNWFHMSPVVLGLTFGSQGLWLLVLLCDGCFYC